MSDNLLDMRLVRSICLVLVAVFVPMKASISAEYDEETFVLGNIEFILLHELAHMLINDLEIPVFGPEENAADYIATIVLIRADRFSPERAERARQFVGAVANGFAGAWERARQSSDGPAYWDGHSLTIQRFYQIVCLLYGSSPRTFPNLPELMGMPAHRADQCPLEFAKADRSVDWLLDTYGPDSEQSNPEVMIDYAEPPTRISLQVLESIRESGMMENTAARLRERLRLPAPFTISTRSCGQRQALWLSDIRTIAICYELFDYFFLLARDRETRRRSESFREE